jgi:hypothetical protein
MGIPLLPSQELVGHLPTFGIMYPLVHGAVRAPARERASHADRSPSRSDESIRSAIDAPFGLITRTARKAKQACAQVTEGLVDRPLDPDIALCADGATTQPAPSSWRPSCCIWRCWGRSG